MSSPETTLTDPAGAETDPVPAPAARPYRRPAQRSRQALTLTAALAAALTSALLPTLTGLSPVAALTLTVLALQAATGAPIGLIDHRHHLIPNWLVGVLAAGTAAALIAHPGLIPPALAAAAAVGAGILVLNLVGAMGMGDVKLAAVCALAWGVHGPALTLLALGAGFILALPAAMMSMRGPTRDKRVALGPWILLGSVTTLTWSLL